METYVAQEQPCPLQQMHCLSMFTNPALPPMSTNPEKHQSLCGTGKESSILVKDHTENCGGRKAVKASSRGGTLRYDISALPCIIRKCDKLASENLVFRGCQHNVFTCQASGRVDEKKHILCGGRTRQCQKTFTKVPPQLRDEWWGQWKPNIRGYSTQYFCVTLIKRVILHVCCHFKRHC